MSWITRILHKGVAASLICSSAGICVQAAPAEKKAVADDGRLSEEPLVLRSGTRQLSSKELATLLADVAMQKVVPPELDWLEPPEIFRSDGKYTLYVHRDKLSGHYTIRRNAVCTKVAGEAEKCRYIFLDVKKRFWISSLRSTRDFTLVDITKIGRTTP